MTINQHFLYRLPTAKMMIMIIKKILIIIVLENNVNYLLKSNCIFVCSNILTCEDLNLFKFLKVKINPAN